MSDQDDGLPPGWRKEWNPPQKARRTVDSSGSVTRARASLSGPLPPMDEIRDTAVRTLLEVATDEDAITTARVGAANALVAYVDKDPTKELLRLLGEDPRRALEWLRGAIPVFERRVAEEERARLPEKKGTEG
jgi:hypothetical protein